MFPAQRVPGFESPGSGVYAISKATVAEVRHRSFGRCEAVDQVPLWDGRPPVPVRCTFEATDVHHALTKGRGGHLLDPFTIYHLRHLCRQHHAQADGATAYTNGLLIAGSVTTVNGHPAYTGPDEYLTQLFPPTGD